MNTLFAVVTLPITILCGILDDKYDIGKKGNNFSYRPRILNFMWAAWFWYFWLPCPLCNKNFGGHEWKESLICSDSSGRGTCPQCIDETNEINKLNLLRK